MASIIAIPDAFEGWDTIQNSKAMGMIFDAMNMFLGAVGLVTLALGAIGVINIMLVTVANALEKSDCARHWARPTTAFCFSFFWREYCLRFSAV